MSRVGLWIAVFVFGAAAAVLAYAGFHTLGIRRSGTPAVATILRCGGSGRTPTCTGRWTMPDGRVVEGVVEGATADDDRLDVVVSSDRAWTQRTASGVGGTALFFAALCLAIAAMLPFNARGSSRR